MGSGFSPPTTGPSWESIISGETDWFVLEEKLSPFLHGVDERLPRSAQGHAPSLCIFPSLSLDLLTRMPMLFNRTAMSIIPGFNGTTGWSSVRAPSHTRRWRYNRCWLLLIVKVDGMYSYHWGGSFMVLEFTCWRDCWCGENFQFRKPYCLAVRPASFIISYVFFPSIRFSIDPVLLKLFLQAIPLCLCVFLPSPCS
jgi:hypothetical protein